MLLTSYMTGFGVGAGNPPLLSAIQSVGLTTNLEVVLDAGDRDSYTSGQVWLDRSGNGFDFDRGVTGGAEGSDPTFNGVVGGLSINEYWSFDGGDLFEYDSANEAWMDNLHQDSAIFTLLTFIYINTVSDEGIAGTEGDARTNVGFRWKVVTDKQGISISDSSGAAALDFVSDGGFTTGAWHMAAVSIDEATGAGAGFLYLDGGYDQVSSSDTFDATYATPSAAGATFVMQLGAKGNSVHELTSGSRIACFAAWEGTALTKANLDSIWARMRGRFAI